MSTRSPELGWHSAIIGASTMLAREAERVELVDLAPARDPDVDGRRRELGERELTSTIGRRTLSTGNGSFVDASPGALPRYEVLVAHGARTAVEHASAPALQLRECKEASRSRSRHEGR